MFHSPYLSYRLHAHPQYENSKFKNQCMTYYPFHSINLIHKTVLIGNKSHKSAITMFINIIGAFCYARN